MSSYLVDTCNKSERRNLLHGGYLSGDVNVPGDKSISHRALLLGAISTGVTEITGLLPAEDPISTAKCLRAMGVKVSDIQNNQVVKVTGVGINGLEEPEEILDCGNSGTTMRLLMGLLVGQEGKHFVLTGDQSLRSRPMRRVSQPLKMMGGKINARSDGNLAPISIIGKSLRGAVIGTPVASAQVKSAIMLAALSAKTGTSVIEPAQSRDHSERMLKAFGAKVEVTGELGRHIKIMPGSELSAQKVVIPGDISSAAFWLIAGSIIPNSNIVIKNVGLNPTRTGILEIMRNMEADLKIINEVEVAGEPVGDINVRYKSNLKAFNIDGNIMPRLIDEIPILTVAACVCDGVSKINGASELRVKETDRLSVITRQLSLMGAKIEEHPSGLTIYGGQSLKGCDLDSETDHRIAMSLAIASIIAENDSSLKNSNAASISYPGFWNDLSRLHKL